MTVKMTVAGATDYALQEAISAYSDEAYTNAKKLNSTGMVGDNPNIDTSSETYIGQARWFKPMTPTINVASLEDPTDGTPSTFGSDFQKYVKTVRTYGGRRVNLQSVVTQQDGLAKIGRDFAEHRAQDESDALLHVLRGVAIAELTYGVAAASGQAGLGGQTFENDPTSLRHGFYVDLGAAKPVVDATTTIQGAARAEGFLRAFGMAYKDHEPEYAYLITSPEMMASFRSANLVDQDRVVDGNVTFNTLFQGKFRLIQSRVAQGLTSAERTKINTGAGVDLVGTKCSFIVLPGALAMRALTIDEPVEIQRNAKAYRGGGTTEIWNRWGYVIMPAGYDWAGSEGAFPTNSAYMNVVEGGTPKALTAVGSGTLASTTGTWLRKTASALSLGILPVFHS
jgi:hypothetical protein